MFYLNEKTKFDLRGATSPPCGHSENPECATGHAAEPNAATESLSRLLDGIRSARSRHTGSIPTHPTYTPLSHYPLLVPLLSR